MTENAMESTTPAGGFADLGLRPELLSALTAVGYEEPTPIQSAAIPPLLEGHDLVGQAATGTGKTAAFALPILERLAAHERTGSGPRAMVLVPTRELAVQVSEAIYRYGNDLGIRSLAVYGGQPIGRQLRALERGVDVIIATPGRALDHIARGTSPCPGCAWWCSTRPTRCSTWASPRTSRRSCNTPRTTGRRCCSPPPCRRGSAAW